MGCAIEGWREQSALWSNALVVGILLSETVIMAIITASFYPVFIELRFVDRIFYFSFSFCTLSFFSIIIYSLYRGWQLTRDCAFRIVWKNMAATTTTILNLLVRNEIPFGRTSLNMFEFFGSGIRERIIIGPSLYKLMVKGRSRRHWSIIFIAQVGTNDTLTLDQLKRIIDEALPIHQPENWRAFDTY